MCVDSNFPKPIPKMFSSVIVIPNSYFESMQRGIEFVNVCTNFESVETQAITIPGASASIKCRSRPPGAAGRPPGPRGPYLKGSISNLSLIFQQNQQTLQGSFSSVSTPIFASKYSLESSRRDLHNALLCTVLQSNFSQKSSTFFRD